MDFLRGQFKQERKEDKRLFTSLVPQEGQQLKSLALHLMPLLLKRKKHSLPPLEGLDRESKACKESKAFRLTKTANGTRQGRRRPRYKNEN